MSAKQYTILDERGNWHAPSIEAARSRGYDAKRITRAQEVEGRTGLGFIRPHAIPQILERNQADYVQMAQHLTMVQDLSQVELYDDKSGQFWRWGTYMPPTWRFESKVSALAFLHSAEAPLQLVSKADVGASSKNVRVLLTRADQIAHVRQVFDRGIRVDHCAGGGREGRQAFSFQRGYVLLQEYVPHEVTWRVNAVGRGRAVFKRYNHPGGLTAQTGNVEALVAIENELENRVLDFADVLFTGPLSTHWCALDILHDARKDVLYLIETSLGWPWPSPNNCMEGVFFGAINTPRRWAEMWELMLDEYEAGTWTDESIGRFTTFG
jgi:hypothetical protein